MGKSKIKKDDGGGVSSEWLNTYADMVTLLLTFFVLLFSMSSINPVKWDKLIQTYGNQKAAVSQIQEKEKNPSDVQQNEQSEETSEEQNLKIEDEIQRFLRHIENPEAVDVSDIQEELTFENVYEIMNQYIVNNDLVDKVGLDRDENFVMIRFKDRAFFDPGKADLKMESTFIVKAITAAINLVQDQVDTVKIVGHTDNTPQHTAIIPDNRMLSLWRAYQVSLFLEEYGIPGNKISIDGKAEFEPIAPNETPEGRAQNRRVEIIVTRKELPRAADGQETAEEETGEVAGEEVNTEAEAPENTEPAAEE